VNWKGRSREFREEIGGNLGETEGNLGWESQGRHRRNFEKSRMGDPLETLGELWEIHGSKKDI
jgi:hypothetical protein